MLSISGLVDDWRVQRCRSLAAGLNVEYEVRAMLEADWEKHLATTALTVPQVITHASSPLVLLHDVYVGGLEAFEALAAEEGHVAAFDKKRLDKSARTLFLSALVKRRRKFAYVDVRIEIGKPKKIILELFTDVCPKTCDRFVQLDYRDCEFHRVVSGGWIQTGRIDGVEPLPDESFSVKFDRPGIVAVANSGRPHTNGSQFFITLAPMPWLDNSYVAFAAVVKGMSVVRQIAAYQDAPCRIASCGTVSLQDGAGLF